jgi:hypothetical protein
LRQKEETDKLGTVLALLNMGVSTGVDKLGYQESKNVESQIFPLVRREKGLYRKWIMVM